MTSGQTTDRRARRNLVLLTPAIIAIGLAARFGLSGAPANFIGVALWSTLVYVLVLFIRPRLTPMQAGLTTGIISAVVEFSQLTPVPLYLADKHVLFRLALGSHFDAWDLPAYATGTVIAALAHGLVQRSTSTNASIE